MKVFGTTIFGNLVYVVTLKVSKHLLWDWLGYKVLVVLLTYFAYHRLYSKLDLLSMENSPPSLARRVKAKDGQVEWDILGSE